MATLQLINNIGADVELTDVGFVIPPGGDIFTNPDHLIRLAGSNDLRARLVANDLTANDGVANMSAQEAIVYLSILWQKNGRDEVAGIRILASGTTLVASSSTVTLATVAKFATERLSIFLFVTDDVAGAGFGEGLGSINGDSVRVFFERTSTPNECVARAQNAALAARTVQWAVVGMRV